MPFIFNPFQMNLFHSMLEQFPDDMEVVLTGRNPSEQLCEWADYLTEMKKIKHPFDQGVKARKGIEY